MSTPVIVVEARKEGGWRVAVKELDVTTCPNHSRYLWQRVAGTIGNVQTFLESAAAFRSKMLAKAQTKNG